LLTLSHCCAELDPALLTWAHAGAKAYRPTVEVRSRREAGTSNDIWQAEHTLLDLWVRQDSGPCAALAHGHDG